MKKICRVVAVLLLCSFLLTAIGGCMRISRPLVYLKNAIERTLKDSPFGEAAALFVEALSGGSVQFEIEGEEALIAGVSAAEGKLYFGKNNSGFMLQGEVTADGVRYDGSLWLTQREAAVSSTAFLGSTTLGVSFGSLEEDLKHSIFRNNSNTAFSKETVNDKTAEATNVLVEGLFSTYEDAEILYSFLDEYFECFLQCLIEYAPHTRYSHKGYVHLTLTVDNSILSRALRDTWAKAERDGRLCRKLAEVAATRDAVESARRGVTVTAHTDRVTRFFGSDAEIEALCAKIDNLALFELELAASVRKLTGKIGYFDVSFTQAEKDFGLALDFTEKDAFSAKILKNGAEYKLTLAETKDSFRAYEADIVYERTDGEGSVTYKGAFALDAKTDKYSLTLESEGESRAFYGTWYCGLSRFAFSVDEILQNCEDTGLSLSIEIRSRDKMPEMPQYVNAATVSEERFRPVAERADAALATFSAAVDKDALTKENFAALFFDILGIF